MKKQNYGNAITTDLINLLDYMPARSPRGDYIIGSKIRVLEKREFNSYKAHHILDGDLFDPNMLKGHIDNTIDFIQRLSGNVAERTEADLTIVYNYSPEPAIYNILRSYSYALDSGMLKIFLVELMTGIVSFIGKDKPQEIENILSARLFQNLDSFDNLGDLEKTVYKAYPKNPIEEVTDKPVATYTLVTINVLVFVLGLVIQLVTDRNLLSDIGIKSYLKIIDGEYWRFITPIFLHAGIAHLATNSFSLIIFGRTMERIFGTAKFLVIYFAAGIAGNIASFAFTPNNSLGASGAILGLGGALIYLWRRNRSFFAVRKQQYMTLVFMVILNLVYGFSQVGIDNFAHLGGAACGFLMAGILGYGNFRDKSSKRIIYAIVLAFLIVICLVLGYTAFAFYRFI